MFEREGNLKFKGREVKTIANVLLKEVGFLKVIDKDIVFWNTLFTNALKYNRLPLNQFKETFFIQS